MHASVNDERERYDRLKLSKTILNDAGEWEQREQWALIANKNYLFPLFLLRLLHYYVFFAFPLFPDTIIPINYYIAKHLLCAQILVGEFASCHELVNPK